MYYYSSSWEPAHTYDYYVVQRWLVTANALPSHLGALSSSYTEPLAHPKEHVIAPLLTTPLLSSSAIVHLHCHPLQPGHIMRGSQWAIRSNPFTASSIKSEISIHIFPTVVARLIHIDLAVISLAVQ